MAAFIRIQKAADTHARHVSLRKVVKAVSSWTEGDTVDKLLTQLVQLSYEVVDADRVTLFLVDPITGDLYFKVAHEDIASLDVRIKMGNK